MLCMGLDQSFTKTGIVIYETETDELIYHSLFVTDKTTNKFSRCILIADEIIRIINEFKPSIVSIEGLSFASTGNAIRDLAGLQFVIVTRLMDLVNLDDIILVPPTTAKKLALGLNTNNLTGKTKNDIINSLPVDIKRKMQGNRKKGAGDRYQFSTTTGLADLADAWFIAHAGYLKWVNSEAEKIVIERTKKKKAEK